MNAWMNGWMARLSLAVFLCLPGATNLRADPRKLRLGRRRGSALAPRTFTWGPGPAFRDLPSTCLQRPDRATPCPQSPQKWGLVLAGPHLSEASAESSCWCECRERSRAEEMSEGEWDNQAPAVKTATHSSLSDSTREIFQTCQLLPVSNGWEKGAPNKAHRASADWLQPSQVLAGQIQRGYEGHSEGAAAGEEGNGGSIWSGVSD